MPLLGILQKRTESTFAGTGVETVITREGIVVAHVRGWDNAHVQDVALADSLVGKHWTQLICDDWEALSDFELENARAWAENVINGFH